MEILESEWFYDLVSRKWLRLIYDSMYYSVSRWYPWLQLAQGFFFFFRNVLESLLDCIHDTKPRLHHNSVCMSYGYLLKPSLSSWIWYTLSLALSLWLSTWALPLSSSPQCIPVSLSVSQSVSMTEPLPWLFTLAFIIILDLIYSVSLSFFVTFYVSSSSVFISSVYSCQSVSQSVCLSVCLYDS